MPLTGQDQALWLALRQKNLGGVLKALGMGANSHSLDPDAGDSLLHVAVRESFTTGVSLLIDKKAVVNRVNRAGDSPLHEAIRQGNKTLAVLLLEQGAWINASNRRGETPLYVAVERGDEQLVHFLLTYHPCLSQHHDLESPLALTERRAKTASPSSASASLYQRLADSLRKVMPPSQPTLTLETLKKFVLAACQGDITTVKHYLEQGFSPWRKSSGSGISVWLGVTSGSPPSAPQDHVLRTDHLAVMEALAASGALLTETTPDGLNALMFAAKCGAVERVRWLCAHTALILERAKQGQTALDIAHAAGQEAVVKVLISHGASLTVSPQILVPKTPPKPPRKPMTIKQIHDCYQALRLPLLFNPSQEKSFSQGYVPISLWEAQQVEASPRSSEKTTEDSSSTGEQDPYARLYLKPEVSWQSPEDFFKIPASSKHLAIVGRAGSGKTTLCRTLVQRVASGKLWPGQFDGVVWISLRNLTATHYPDKPDGEGYSLTELFQAEFERLFQPAFELTTTVAEAYLDPKRRLLWLLDGYDELPTPPPHSQLAMVVNQLLREPYVILTSRPTVLSNFSADTTLELVGFTDQHLETYITQFFTHTPLPKNTSRTAQDLVHLLKTQPNLWALAHIPVIVEILCSLWADTTFSLSSPQTTTALYQQILTWLLHRQTLKHGETFKGTEALEKSAYVSLTLLEHLAFTAIDKQTPLLTPEQLKSTLLKVLPQANEKQCVEAFEAVSALGLLKTSVPTGFCPSTKSLEMEYHFLHLSLQEFCAARYLQRSFSTSEVQTWITTHRYESFTQVTLSFLSGLLSLAPDLTPYSQFWDLLNAEPRDLIGLAHLALTTACAAEAENDKLLPAQLAIQQQWVGLLEKFRRFSDDSTQSSLQLATLPLLQRAPALLRQEAFQQVLLEGLKQKDNIEDTCYLLQILGPAAATLAVYERLLKILGDTDRNVRIAAAKAIGKLSSQVTTPVVCEGLLELLDDTNDHVRLVVAEALGQLGSAAATPAVPEGLLKALRDTESIFVRIAAGKALGNIASQATISTLCESLLKMLDDTDSLMRSTVVNALGYLGSQASITVSEGLLKRLGDRNAFVRWYAAEALGRLDPQAATPAIKEGLLKRLRDSEPLVSIAAARALGNLNLQAAIPAVRENLLKKLGDTNPSIRQSAVEALECLGPQAATKAVCEGLLKALDDRILSVSIAAARALGNLNLQAAIPAVRENLLKKLGHTRPIVRESAVEALECLGPQAATKAVCEGLLKALGDTDSSVKKAAARTLNKFNPRVTLPIIWSTKVLVDSFKTMNLMSTLLLAGIAQQLVILPTPTGLLIQSRGFRKVLKVMPKQREEVVVILDALSILAIKYGLPVTPTPLCSLLTWCLPTSVGSPKPPTPEKSAPAKPSLSFKSDVVDTLGDGNCAFHAPLGTLRNGQIQCQTVSAEREKVADYVRKHQKTPEIRRYVIAILSELIMNKDRFAQEKVSDLYERYWQHLDQTQPEAIWEPLYALLEQEQYKTTREQIELNHQVDEVSLKKATTPERQLLLKFQHVLNSSHRVSLEQAIAKTTPLNDAYQRYNQGSGRTGSGFAWETIITEQAIEALINHYIQPSGIWVIGETFGLMAYATNKTIHYYSAPNTTQPVTYNPGQIDQVSVQHDGHHHYEKISPNRRTRALTEFLSQLGFFGKNNYENQTITTLISEFEEGVLPPLC